MNKYTEKLNNIKSRKLGPFERYKYFIYFLTLLIFSFLILVYGFKGLFEVLMISDTGNKEWANYISITLLVIAILSLLFLFFKMIGKALTYLTTCISGITEINYSAKRNNKPTRFYWLLYSVVFFISLLLMAPQAKQNNIGLLLFLFATYISTGLFGLSFHKAIYKKIIWKLVFYIQIIIFFAVVLLYFYFQISLNHATMPFEFTKNIFLIFLMGFYFLVSIYGVWKYAYQCNGLWKTI